MNGFTLHLQSATQYQRVDDVASFVGSDGSGTFGLLPQHERFMTVVEFGLARYRGFDNVWYYLALPGALVYFVDNALYVSTRRYVVGDDCQRVAATLAETLRTEEHEILQLKGTLVKLEHEMMRRLWHVGLTED